MRVRELSYELLSIKAEAYRICDARGLDTSDEFAQIAAALMQRAYQDSIRPLLDVKVHILSVVMPNVAYFPDTGEIVTLDDGLSEEALATLRKIDEAIALIAERFK